MNTIGQTMLALVLMTTGFLHALAQERIAYEPSLTKRIEYANAVCSATIVSNHGTGKQEVIGGADRDEFVVEAERLRCFKGTVPLHFQFKSFGIGHLDHDYFGPPLADFRPGSTYIVFLKGDNQDLQVAVPIFQWEIRITRQGPSQVEATAQPSAAFAQELFQSVRAEFMTIGRMATRYFDWAEELVGDHAVPPVKSFLSSDDELIKYQAAWWLSFREVSNPVLDVLAETSKNSTIEEWARSGATDRLRDMKNGLLLPPHRREVRVNE